MDQQIHEPFSGCEAVVAAGGAQAGGGLSSVPLPVHASSRSPPQLPSAPQTDSDPQSACSVSSSAGDSDDPDDPNIKVCFTASRADVPRFLREVGGVFEGVLPSAVDQGKVFMYKDMRPGEARRFGRAANEWLARNCERPALVAERTATATPHSVVLWRRPHQPDEFKRPRPLPSCWTARFVRRAAPYVQAARLQPALLAAKRSSRSDPAFELQLYATTAHGLIQIVALADEHGLGTRGRAEPAVSIALRLVDGLTWAPACAAVQSQLAEMLGATHQQQVSGGAVWRVAAAKAEAVVKALSRPQIRDLLADQRIELPDLARAARGPV